MAKKKHQLGLHDTDHPVLYEVNTRVLLHELSAGAAAPVTLATIPEEVLDEWAALGIDAVWLMGVWSTGDVGLEIARTLPALEEEFRLALPDLTVDDIIGSPYAVQDFKVSRALGGGLALRSLRTRLKNRGIGLVLDAVINHTARDHPWVRQHPEWYMQHDPAGGPAGFQDGFLAQTQVGERFIAFGRDPMYPGWSDTAQVNIRSRSARAALIAELGRIARMCDGVRCDMAMLLLSDVFERTWGDFCRPVLEYSAQGEFWKEAIDAVVAAHPGFMFIAESYWNREWDLQQQGFRYTYDKTLYDRMLREGASAVRDHLKADREFQHRSLRFIENHDEERASKILPGEPWHYAAAAIVATVPGMLLLHDGQLDGRTVRVPVQLRRRMQEPVNKRTRAFYEQLLSAISHPVFCNGEWRLLPMRPAWHDNPTWQNFLVFWWHEPSRGNRLIVINYAPHSGQCYVELPLDFLEGGLLEFRDLIGSAVYVRERSVIEARGMYFDLAEYGLHIFEVKDARKPSP